jgi:phosphoribosyl-dephospho-CoA transferase
MSLPTQANEVGFMRYRLIRVASSGWEVLSREREDVTARAWLRNWAIHRRPLITRRQGPDDRIGVPVGMPLPPSAGKRRLAFNIQPSDIEAVGLMPELSTTLKEVPESWRASLNALIDVANECGVRVRVHGSLAWQWITGLKYITPGSDVDVICDMPPPDQVAPFLRAMTRISEEAPMRIDGELIRDDGSGANWRELCGGSRDVVVKTATGVQLCAMEDFLGRCA